MKLIFLTLILFSCAKQALVTQKNLDANSFKDSISSVCLLGEGKGKIVFGSKRFVFSYDSLFKGNSWLLEVSIPFRGSETMKITRSENKLKFEGNFYKMVKQRFTAYAMDQEDYEPEDLKHLLKFTAGELFRVRNFKKKLDQDGQSYFTKWCSSTPVGFCTREFQNTKYYIHPNKVEVAKKHDKYSLSWINENMVSKDHKHYKESSFTLKREGIKILEASFYPSRCQSDPSPL